jgi:hypothetical protein
MSTIDEENILEIAIISKKKAIDGLMETTEIAHHHIQEIRDNLASSSEKLQKSGIIAGALFAQCFIKYKNEYLSYDKFRLEIREKDDD